MKKNILPIFIILTLFFTVFISSCEEEETSDRDFPAYLEGRWVRTSTNDLPDFTISKDLSFTCEVEMPPSPGPHAMVSGKLDYKAEGLGPNDYIIRDMKTVGSAPQFTEGNDQLNSQLGGFQNLLVSLTPNDDKSKFTFSSKNQAAQVFFGGEFTKK